MLAWYRANARDLPWRRTRDPYRIWLSEIMLQQTRVKTVRPYYDRFTRAFPRVEDLAAAGAGEVLKLWEGLGYYSRARHLLEAARWVVREGGGRFPETAAELVGLPGVGRYTAGAIASIAFGERAPVLDGNVKRVLARLFLVREPVDEGATEARLWTLAAALVSPRAPGDSNQALMELGARVCRPRRPDCTVCPVRALCRARAAGEAEALPARRAARRALPHHEIVAAAIGRNGRYLFGQRPLGGLLGGLWEFPGGKVERGEAHAEALVRELREELGVETAVGARIASLEHAYSHFRITLHLHRARISRGRPVPRFHTELKWLLPAQFDRYAFPAATRRLLAVLGRAKTGAKR
ncbi:MAG: A/G-specific adenine glycosylase [Planctomycetes bacterium]|nr:A/G-specific adenine glycosylase [Planctomycetota bacterium]